ncbi:MAG: hypothetical protein ACYSUF_09930, partial [Planctomycetota bacterium]
MSSAQSLSIATLGLMLAVTTAWPDLARAESSDAALEARARRLLEKVPLIDGHNDVPWRYRDSA